MSTLKIKSKLQQIEKEATKIIADMENPYKFSADDWSLEQLLELVNDPTPEIVEKAEQTDFTGWETWLESLSTSNE